MFENMFGKKPEDESEKIPEINLVEDETGAMISQKMADEDRRFKEERE